MQPQIVSEQELYSQLLTKLAVCEACRQMADDPNDPDRNRWEREYERHVNEAYDMAMQLQALRGGGVVQ